MTRPSWGSRIGFIFAVAGSAVGLANIWRFPYIVGQHGGAAFLAVYFLSLLLIGFPVFIAEIVIGRSAQSNPSGAFLALGGRRFWGWIGKMTIITGFIVSSFYSAVAAWILGYLFEAIQGNITSFSSSSHAVIHYETLIANPFWCSGFHLLFLLLCSFVLYSGVREGIERSNKILMPLLFLLLILLVIKGLTLDHAFQGVHYLLNPDWSELSPTAIMIALGQSFFTLSLGQGTMVTYGSYLDKKTNLIRSCTPVVLMDTLVSILAAIAVFSIVFAGGLETNSGPGLLFHTLPLIFGKIPGGYFVALAFFFLVLIAAITSQISAMEPAIAYLIDEKGWKRHPAVACVTVAVFLTGLPCALSYSLLKDWNFFGMPILDSISFFASSLLIPLGGFAAVLFAGWFWGFKKTLSALKSGAEEDFEKKKWLVPYFWFCLKYSAPILMIFVFLNAIYG